MIVYGMIHFEMTWWTWEGVRGQDEQESYVLSSLYILCTFV